MWLAALDLHGAVKATPSAFGQRLRRHRPSPTQIDCARRQIAAGDAATVVAGVGASSQGPPPETETLQ
jgi:hypothetical protein